jgi:hypothetical protein
MPADERHVGDLLVGDVRIEIGVVDEAMLILRIGCARQVRMQEGADIDDVGMRIGCERVPGPQAGRLGPADIALIFVLGDFRVRRIEVGVDGDERASDPVPMRMTGTRRHVMHECQVGIEAQCAGADIVGSAIEELAVGDVLAPVRKTLRSDRQSATDCENCRYPAAPWRGRHGPNRRCRPRYRSAVPPVPPGNAIPGRRRQRRCSVHDRCRALQHLDPVNVIYVEGRDGGVERAAPWNAVHDQQKGVELVQAPEGRDGARGTRVAACRRFDPGHEAQRGLQVPRVARAQLASRDDRRVGRDAIVWLPAHALPSPRPVRYHFPSAQLPPS